MGYADRRILFQELEASRQRPLICFVTNSRQNAKGQMASDVIPELANQLNLIPREQKSIDILIVSEGGDPTVSWRFISMLREKFDEVAVLLPFAAYSAATLLALGANEILMHPFSNLGPVDPQLISVKGQGQQQEVSQFGSEDLRHYFDFIRKDVGISDQAQLQASFNLICNDVGAVRIGVAKRSSYLAVSMGEKLLGLHMNDDNKTHAIAEALNTSFYHHGYPVGRKEAKSIGLPISDPDPAIEQLMWEIWKDYENEMECNKPFLPLEEIFRDQDLANQLSHVPQAQVPLNLPPPILGQIYQQLIQNSVTVMNRPVDYSLFLAALESLRCRSEFRLSGKINAVRNFDLTIGISLSPLMQSWEFIPNPDPDENVN